MKKILSFILVIALCLTMCVSFISCGGEDEPDESGDQGVIDSLVLKGKLVALSGKANDIKTPFGQEVLMLALTEIFEENNNVINGNSEDLVELKLSNFINKEHCDHPDECLKVRSMGFDLHYIKCEESLGGCGTIVVINENHNTINGVCDICDGGPSEEMVPLYESNIDNIPVGKTMYPTTYDGECSHPNLIYSKFSTFYHRVECPKCDMVGWWPHTVVDNVCTFCSQTFDVQPDPVSEDTNDVTDTTVNDTIVSDPEDTNNETNNTTDVTTDPETTNSPEEELDPTVKELIGMIDNNADYQYINKVVINILLIEELDPDHEVICFRSVTEITDKEYFSVLLGIVEEAIKDEKLEADYTEFVWDEQEFNVGFLTNYAATRISKVQTKSNLEIIKNFLDALGE